jgi:hypothetical protein
MRIVKQIKRSPTICLSSYRTNSEISRMDIQRDINTNYELMLTVLFMAGVSFGALILILMIVAFI